MITDVQDRNREIEVAIRGLVHGGGGGGGMSYLLHNNILHVHLKPNSCSVIIIIIYCSRNHNISMVASTQWLKRGGGSKRELEPSSPNLKWEWGSLGLLKGFFLEYDIIMAHHVYITFLFSLNIFTPHLYIEAWATL